MEILSTLWKNTEDLPCRILMIGSPPRHQAHSWYPSSWTFLSPSFCRRFFLLSSVIHCLLLLIPCCLPTHTYHFSPTCSHLFKQQNTPFQNQRITFLLSPTGPLWALSIHWICSHWFSLCSLPGLYYILVFYRQFILLLTCFLLVSAWLTLQAWKCRQYSLPKWQWTST
jgi:hypothetical protein